MIAIVGVAATSFGSSAANAAVQIYESPQPGGAITLQETPALVEMVESGELPPIAERLPENPAISQTTEFRDIGKSGGDLHTLVTRAKDTRLLVVYGYARLISFDDELNLVPDILERLEVEDGKVFTLHLRKGHRWSDGHPFTTEDFRYFWEDVANNDALFPTGPPVELKAGGVPAQVEIIDETTIRYSWPSPNPFFVPALAGARPLFIFRPAHYMKQFHQKYGDQAHIDQAAKKAGVRNWAELHNRLDNLYKFDNPDLPTLQPWFNTVRPPTTRFIAKRNPYYHRIDESGQQLPYFDRFILNVVGAALVPAKSGAGESDLQARGLNFTDYTFLKENEARSGYDVRLWRNMKGSQLALYPNLTVNDPDWRALLRDVRFRHALSLGIDREEINDVIYYGLCVIGNNGVLPDSPLYNEEFHLAWTQFDPDLANKLLDEIGLTERNKDGIRLMPNGKPLEIIVETAGENTEEVDVLELIHDTWLDIGVKLYTKPSQRELLRNRIFAGDTVMAMWYGYDNGIPTADMSPEWLAPVHQHSFHWPKWGQYQETSGHAGEKVDMPLPQELMDLYNEWIASGSTEERAEIWHRMLEIHSEQTYTIGLVAQVPQPVVVSNEIHNVPEEGIFNWDPGAQFGIYRPETFWRGQ
ncbi:MAG: ABC transporter substrate-binding protein [Pseudomonadota bacterium]